MKFLIDAQLPARLARFLQESGHDAVHSLSLPNGNRSTDAEIATGANEENRVVVSKDRDFRDAHLLRGVPRRLLLVLTGNISNDELLELFRLNLAEIVNALEEMHFAELTPTNLIIHDDR